MFVSADKSNQNGAEPNGAISSPRAAILFTSATDLTGPGRNRFLLKSDKTNIKEKHNKKRVDSDQISRPQGIKGERPLGTRLPEPSISGADQKDHGSRTRSRDKIYLQSCACTVWQNGQETRALGTRIGFLR